MPSAGFSLIELLTTMVVIAVLAVIAVPNYKAMKLKGLAVEVIADIKVVEQAAQLYHADQNTWPVEVGPGAIPSGLGSYLPAGFSFTGEGVFMLDWENIGVPGGLPSGATRLVGVGVTTDEPGLPEALVTTFGESTWYIIGSTHIRIFDEG